MEVHVIRENSAFSIKMSEIFFPIKRKFFLIPYSTILPWKYIKEKILLCSAEFQRRTDPMNGMFLLKKIKIQEIWLFYHESGCILMHVQDSIHKMSAFPDLAPKLLQNQLHLIAYCDNLHFNHVLEGALSVKDVVISSKK